jgi:hypothetical protein
MVCGAFRGWCFLVMRKKDMSSSAKAITYLYKIIMPLKAGTEHIGKEKKQE